MPQELPRTGTPAMPTMPKVNALTVADLRACLAQGISDFARAPLFGLFFGAVFTIIGMVIVLALTSWHMPWMIYPFAIGFPLVAMGVEGDATEVAYPFLVREDNDRVMCGFSMAGPAPSIRDGIVIEMGARLLWAAEGRFLSPRTNR